MAEDPDDLDYWGSALLEDAGRLPLWLPVIDGDFIPDEPAQIYRNGGGNIPDVDMITGTNNSISNLSVMKCA